uniref:PAN domain protein n=1 Tax=Caenorhabditis tropicalis TaxID=1561998 RepID=A0A1I7TRC8_9PELO
MTSTISTGLVCLVLVLIQQVYGDCSPEFFARSIRYDQAVEIDFYHTGINLASVKECATFCSQREFCRSAVYNSRTKTCGISYEYTIACASRTQRYKEYQLEEGQGTDLVQIACVDDCRNREGKDTDKKEKKVPVGIITGEPNDGNQKETGNSVITDPLTTPSVSKLSSSTPAVSESDRPRADGYVTRLILANISSLREGGTGSVEPLTLQQNDASVAKGGKGPVCYRTIRHRYLLGADFEEHDVDSVNDCRCLCAATHLPSNKKHKCLSFQFRNKSCVLNRGNHLGQYDLIEQRKTLYQYVGCDPEILIETAASKCPNFKIKAAHEKKSEKSEKAEKPKETTTKKPKVELITAKTVEGEKKKTTTKKPSPSKKTTTKAPTTTEKPTTAAPSKKSRPTGNDAGDENSNSVEAKPTEMIIKRDGCFEVIDDHLMVSVAGGLEHDVSIEECQCMCANSKKSERYEFQCRSATYYHTERDCILNLEDRNMKSKLFERQFIALNVSYIGMSCEIDETVVSLGSLANTGCKRQQVTTTGEPPKEQPAKKNGLKSDECYVELNDFVLEGTAIAVETAVTPEECKCKCAEGPKLYGEECASFLYYYDSKTCLINKQNRFSNPEKFNFVPSINQSRSYFEWTCANKDEARHKYREDVCKFEPEKVEGNLLNNESDPVEVKNDVKMAEDTGRLKRLDEKEFLDKIEKVVESREEIEKKKKVTTKMSEHILDAYEVLKKIEKVEALEATTEAITTTEEATTTTEEVTTPKKEEVSMKPVDEKILMEKINEAVVKLENSREVTEEATTEEPVTTTTAKLILNTKKSPLKEAKSKNGSTVAMKKADPKTLDTLLKAKVTEGGLDLAEQEKLSGDPKHVNMKKVEAQVLEKLAKMEITESSVTEAIPEAFSSSVTPKTSRKSSIPEAEGLEDDEVDDNIGEELSTGLDDEPTTESAPETTVPVTSTTEKATTTSTAKAKASGVKTHKFDEKVDKSGMPLPRLSTTTEEPTTTAGYPPAGRCSYSALYQTSFLGRRLLKAVRVKTPADCFAACYALRCRSANLIAQGEFNSCELYRDSLIDYRRPDMIGYDASTVYFDGINCDGSP